MTAPASSPGLRRRLHERGYRLTPQRRLVLDAVASLGAATPEQIAAQPALVEARVNITTVYRAVELLEELGLVTHTHLGHGAPRYQPARAEQHVHVVCHRCGAVSDAPAEMAAELVARLAEDRGFAVDIGHLSVSGTCARCRQTGR